MHQMVHLPETWKQKPKFQHGTFNYPGVKYQIRLSLLVLLSSAVL